MEFDRFFYKERRMSFSFEKCKRVKEGFTSAEAFHLSHNKTNIRSSGLGGSSGLPLDEQNGTVWVNNPEYHALICGASGIGKTRRVLYPAVALSARAGHSMIIADMKGEIYRHTAEEVRRCGLDVKVINLRNPSKGDHFNPLSLVEEYWHNGNHSRATILLKDIASVITGNISSSLDKFWQTAAIDAIVGFSLLILEKNESLTLENVQSLFNDYVSYDKEEERPRVAAGFDKESDSYKHLATVVTLTTDNTLSCISSEVNACLSPYTDQEDVRMLLSTSDVKLKDIGTRPTAVYLVCPDESTALYGIASLFVEQSYSELIAYADNREDNILPVKVDYVLDEFGSFVGSDWPSKLTAARSRGIRFYLAIQAMSQLISRYGESGARTIMSNCRTLMYMGGRDSWLMNELYLFGGFVKDPDTHIERPVLSASEMQSLNPGQVLILDGNSRPFIGNLPDWECWNVKKSSEPGSGYGRQNARQVLNLKKLLNIRREDEFEDEKRRDESLDDFVKFLEGRVGQSADSDEEEQMF